MVLGGVLFGQTSFVMLTPRSRCLHRRNHLRKEKAQVDSKAQVSTTETPHIFLAMKSKMVLYFKEFSAVVVRFMRAQLTRVDEY